MSSIDSNLTSSSSSSNDKQNALDAIPTSSTDANVTFAKTETVVEDPISSTSSEVCPPKCSEEESDNFGNSDVSSVNMGQLKTIEQEKSSAIESEEEFLNLNMENVSNERITEDVEDIVHDLENLLGDSYSVPDRSARSSTKTTEDVSLALEELEELTKKDNEPQQTISESNVTNVDEQQQAPHDILLPTERVSPNVELDKAATALQIPEKHELEDLPQTIKTTELTNEEPEVVPVITEPEQETTNVSTVSETEISEIHSTIGEASPQRKAQKIKLIRSPITVAIEEIDSPTQELVVEKPAEAAISIETVATASETLPPPLNSDAELMEVEDCLPPTSESMEIEPTPLIEKFSPEPVVDEEPMLVEEDTKDKNVVEVEMKDESVLIDDPVVGIGIETKDLIVPVELAPSPVDDLAEIVPIDTENVVAVAEEAPLIAESSVIDELIETAALDNIVTEPIESSDPLPDFERLESEDVVDSLKLNEETGNELLKAVDNIEGVLPILEEKESDTTGSIEVAVQHDTKQIESVIEQPLATSQIKEETNFNVILPETSGISDVITQKVMQPPVTSPIKEETTLNDILPETSGISDVMTQKVIEIPLTTEVEKVEHTENVENVTVGALESDFAVQNESILAENVAESENETLAPQMIDPSLKTTLTVDVNDQGPPTIFDENAGLVSPKTVTKQESQHLLKITISKQADNTHSILKVCSPGESNQSSENIEKIPKISIKTLMSPSKSAKLMSPTGVPKLTIKPIVKPDSPVKLTIKPIVKPDDIHEQQRSSPKLTIKPIIKPEEAHEQQRASPKLTIKPIVKPDDFHEQQKSSPKLTIKPIVKPADDPSEIIQIEEELQKQARSSPKITIKPIVKPEIEQKFSPKLTIKPIVKPDETIDVEQYHQKCSPKLTIKPIVKPEEMVVQEEQKHPKLTIKPIVRPDEQMHSPKITIKPIVKPHEDTETHRHNLRSAKTDEVHEDVVLEEYSFSHVKANVKTDCPKVIIKPVVKPAETTTSDSVEMEEEIKQERIILKINKNTLPSRKREHSDEKLAKIKVKYSKEGGHAHIVPQSFDHNAEPEIEFRKRFKLDDLNIPQGVTITNIEPGQSLLKDDSNGSQESAMDDVKIEPIERVDTSVFPITQPVIDLESKDPLGDIPCFDNAADFVAATCHTPSVVAATVAVVPSPRRRGRPRKVPLEVREEFKDPPKEVVEEEPPKVVESTRPKRSCRGPSARTTLGIKPRKPRGPGRGRGGKRGTDTRATVMKAGKEPKVAIPKLKLLKETITSAFIADTIDKLIEQPKEIDTKSSSSVTEIIDSTPECRDVAIYEEETRMSADAGSSRAQTPAKQIPTPIADVVVEESQSSVQSSATTESAKARKGPRLEVHQEPEGAIISADQLAEYSWGGGGPYMLQEQVAQFLGIKSFKRKYPGIQRRPVDMQERDFIRESGLASEAMCDLGLTAVNSADILDIMYSDFQPKYEEYCKHQRDRQAKDLTNKQKALTLAVSQEKNNLTEQAVQSAASWNSTFNKARREKRKACMDLQTITIHYPKGRVKQINKTPVGNYPVALVPGQFTDYYKEFTPAELSNLPLNTLCYKTVSATRHQDDDSQSDGSASDSDSSSSDSDSSDSGSSEGENCTMCSPRSSQKQVAAAIH